MDHSGSARGPRQDFAGVAARELGAWAATTALFPLGVTSLTYRLARDVVVPVRPAEERFDVPVVLVHGYGGNRAMWLPLERRLRRAGFADVHAVTYHPVFTDLPSVADKVVRTSHRVMRRAGVDRVHVVAHSLGGILLRYAVARLGLASDVDTAMTIATPHSGCPLAWVGWGALASSARPGSRVLRAISEAPHFSGVTWVSYWSDYDVVVPAHVARLVPQSERVVNVRVPGEGHLSIVRSPFLLDDVVRRLVRAEEARARLARIGPPAPSRVGPTSRAA